MRHALPLGVAPAPLLAALSLGAGCNVIWGLDDRNLLDGGRADVSTPPRDAATEAGPPCTFDASGLGEWSDPHCWATFDLGETDAASTGFEGATFDGRFVYLAPASGGILVRYDTHASFGEASAFETFDLSHVAKGPFVFAGAVFDGRYVVYVPGASATFVRFDTQGGWGDAASWTAFDPTVGAGLSQVSGYAGGSFDGHALYFLPNTSTYAQKFETGRVFTDPTAWTAHHIVGSDAGPGFFGGAFDGRYVYMAPGTLAPDSFGILLRIDTQGDFTQNTSFSSFDMTRVNANAAAYDDAAFDGRYVYLAPSGRSGKAIVTRFDSHGTLGDVSAWSSFDMGAVSPSLGDFFGVAFDGRFLYFPPSGTTSSGPNGHLVRYDTQANFASVTSWATFDTTTVHAAAFRGSVFDGRFLYFAPEASSIILRYEARSTSLPPKPPLFPASFF